MKRIILLLIVSLLLVGCGNSNEVQEVPEEEFTFDGKEFREAYEEHSGKLISNDTELSESSLIVDYASKQEIVDFMEVIEDLANDSKMRNAINTFIEKDEVSGMTDEMIVSISDFGDYYFGVFTPKLKSDE